MFPAACTKQSNTSYENESCVSYCYDSNCIPGQVAFTSIILPMFSTKCKVAYHIKDMWERVDSHAQRRRNIEFASFGRLLEIRVTFVVANAE